MLAAVEPRDRWGVAPSRGRDRRQRDLVRDDAPIHAAVATEDGEGIVTISAAGRLRRWDVRAERCSARSSSDRRACRPPLSARRRLGRRRPRRGSPQVSVWNAVTGAVRGTITAAEPVAVVAVACDGGLAAIGGTKLEIWRTDGCDPPVTTSVRHPARLAFDSGGGRTLAVGYGDMPERSVGWGWVIAIDGDTGKFTRSAHQVSDQRILGIAVDRGGTRIGAASYDRRVYLSGRGPRSPARVPRPPGRDDLRRVRSRGRRLASGSRTRRCACGTRRAAPSSPC
jgi:hypothetical protein